RQAALRPDALRGGESLGEVSSGENHLGARGLRAGHLRERRETRHDDCGRNTEAPAVMRHGLGMITGGYGQDAAAALRLRQRQDLAEGTALLERGGELEYLELQMDAAPGDLGQRLRDGRRGPLNAAGDAGGRGFDVRQGDRQVRRMWHRWIAACPRGDGQRFGT